MWNAPILGNEEGYLILTGAEVAEIFEPLIAKILTLIRGQVTSLLEKDPHARLAGILLVGGFGENKYLFRRVREEFGELVEILQPHNAYVSLSLLGALRDQFAD
jgi:hypothetical protein